MARRRKKEHKIISLDIERLNHDGRGVGYDDGKVQFIFGALPDEKAESKITEQYSRYNTGHALEITEPNPMRTTPRCPHFGSCGGCWLQHATQQLQHNHKCQVLKELFAAQQIEIAPQVLAYGDEYAYRRKARFSVRFVAKKNKVLVGFREHHGRFVADINQCPVLIQEAEKLIVPLSELLFTLECKNSIPQIEVAAGDNALALIIRHLKQLSAEEIDAFSNFAQQHSIQIYLQPKGLDSIHPLYPAKPETLFYKLEAQNLKLEFHPAQFIQVNAAVNAKLIDLAIDFLNCQDNETVLDLFCGIGNFSLALAKTAGKVIGIEGDKTAVERAASNARLNNLDNCKFYATDLTNPEAAWQICPQKIDVLVLDPPRSGAQALIELLNRWQPKKICYISCNPATLARDSKAIIESNYKLEDIGVVDLFPQTAHAESIAYFTRR